MHHGQQGLMVQNEAARLPGISGDLVQRRPEAPLNSQLLIREPDSAARVQSGQTLIVGPDGRLSGEKRVDWKVCSEAAAQRENCKY